MSLFNKNHKKGLSLITVLLFMLVATLAATGVFKWLSTQNKASASRLMQSEVYQASQAGIETARSWMAFHAGDVGALVKQYKDNNRKPILLDSILHPLANDKKQKFSVLLVGADTKSYPYKLKLLSTGMARSGSKYSQVAIIGVDGLYQVEIPTKKTSLDFSYSFWGGSLDFGGGNTISSLVLNGNWFGNPPLITGDFIVTGTINLSGDNAKVSGNTCAGKNLNTNNATGPLRDVYVHQNFENAQGTYENVYVNGNLTQSNKKIQINGNLNVNGIIRPNLGAQEFEVMGNLVLGSEGVLNFDSENRPFTVHKDVWIPNSNGITGAGSNYVHYLGKDNDASLYVSNVTYEWWSGWIYKKFKSNSFNTTFRSSSFNHGVSVDPPTGAEAVKKYCDDIWSKETGCGGSEFLIEDKLITAYNTFKNKAVSSSACPNIKTNFTDGDQMVNSLNDCYNDLKENKTELLHNGFLVVKLNSNNLSSFSTLLNGKFVFIVENPLGQQRLPAMTEKSFVMMYLAQGSGQIMPSKCDGSSFYNYFIYSLKDISELNAFNDNCPITGTVYLPVKDPNTGTLMCMGSTKTQNNTKIDFNQSLLDELSAANILCPNDGSTCGSPSSGTPGSSSSSISSEGLDTYYIAVSPRLKTTLETQYVNKEIDPDTLSTTSYNLLKPSILVMPRTIYLPTNAKGSLNQYYSVLNLNGAKEDSKTGSVSCNPSGLNSSGDLNGSMANVYVCTYSPGNATYNNCPFYVVVDGTMEQNPDVSIALNTTSPLVFNNPNALAGEIQPVYLIVSPGTNLISLGVKITNNSGWSFVPTAAGGDISEVNASSSDLYYFKINAPSVQKAIKLFDVSVGSAGNMAFELVTPVEGATFRNKTAFISVEGTATVQKESLPSYLTQYPDAPDKDSVAKWSDYPDCLSPSSSSWVKAKDACVETEVNKSWSCSVLGTSIYLDQGGLIEGCSAFIPKTDLNKVINPEIDGSYTLYADLKASPYDLVIKTKGSNSKVTFHISDKLSRLSEEYLFLNPGEKVVTQVFHGYNYNIKASSGNSEDHFSYWSCKTASGAECALPSFGESTYPLTPYQAGDTLIAYFNQKSSCFTETFKDLQEDCSASESVRCIDKCASGNACSVDGGEYSTSDWMMVYANSNNDFVKLDIVDDANQGAYAGFGDKPVFILKPVVAGYEGVYTAQIRAYPKNSIMSNQSLNTGLVFRSNATGTSYFTLSVLSKKKDNTDLLRVCYATQSKIANEAQCITKGDALSTWSGNNIDNVETFTVKAVLEGNTLLVSVVDGDNGVYIPVTSFDLSDPKFGATGITQSDNQYVGFKLYGDHFRYYSLTWNSKTYSCIDKSSFYCSFKANYAGGRIPANTDVTPWAYVSNFCDNEDDCCTYNYIPAAPMQFGPGNYSDQTVKVSANCMLGGISTIFDPISCGSFFVGDRKSCIEDIVISSSESCYDECEITLSETSNFRDVSLNLDLTLNGEDTISVYFVDANGVQSLSGGYMTKTGSYSLDFSDFIDAEMFNPEQITKVLFKSVNGNSFDVKNLLVSCPNSTKLNSCTVSYDGTDLIFGANVSNASSCSISGPNVSETGIPCDGSWTYHYPVDLSAYAGQSPSWTISAYNALDPNIIETCTNSASIKAPSGSCSWSPMTLKATVNGSAQFTANFVDCPAAGCNYVIKDHNNNEVANGKGTVGTASFVTPATVGTYTYSAFINENTICNASLTISEGVAPTASCGGVTQEGTFAASVNDQDNVGWNYQVVVTDNIGNIIHSSPTSETKTGTQNISYSGYNPSVAGTYYYKLILNGNEVCSSSLTVTGSITNCSLTPTTINPGEYVTFTATTEKVANETACSIKHSGGTDVTSGSPKVSGNQCSSTFYPTLAGAYSVNIAGYSRSCGTVTINGGTSSCDYQSSWCNGIDWDNVIILPTGSYDNNSSTLPAEARVWDKNKCFFIKSPCSVFQNVNSTHAGDGGCYAYRSASEWWKVNNGTEGNPDCSGGSVTSSSSSVVTPSSSSEASSSSGGGTTISIGHGGSSYVTFTEGTYQLSLTSQGSVFRCTIAGTVDYDRTVASFNGSNLVIPAWNDFGIVPTSMTSASFTVNSGYTLSCAKDW